MASLLGLAAPFNDVNIYPAINDYMPVAISAPRSRSNEVMLEGPKTVEVGQGLLKLSFALRAIPDRTQSSAARVRVRLATTVSGNLLLDREISATGTWEPMEIAVSVKWPKPGDTIRCQFRFAGGTQPFELGGLTLTFFSEKQLAALAPQRPRIDQFPPLPPGKQWKLVWNDEFDGTAVDEAKWNVGEGKRNDVIRSRKAVSLDGKGHLVMSIFRDGPNIYDGWVDTKGKYEVWRTQAGGVCQVPAELRLTDEASAKAGNWAGSVLAATLPDAWYVDYVRVYDLADEEIRKEAVKFSD